jgi:hypothetical protein
MMGKKFTICVFVPGTVAPVQTFKHCMNLVIGERGGIKFTDDRDHAQYTNLVYLATEE